MEFLGRFRNNGYLRFGQIDQIIARSLDFDPGDESDDEYHSDWERYSWKCRFVFIPEKQLWDLTATSPSPFWQNYSDIYLGVTTVHIDPNHLYSSTLFCQILSVGT